MPEDNPNPERLWEKGVAAEDWVTRFTVGDDPMWDQLLLPYDLTASAAHAWGLAQIGILDAEELAELEGALEDLRRQHTEGKLRVRTEDEDCHTVIERALTERLGDTGRKIHAGRSRNDQVLAALRLWVRDQLKGLGMQTARLVEELASLGAEYESVPLPGYTHMQRAMPSTAGLWALGYGELLAEDLRLLGESAAHINVSPLGSAAGYGVPYLVLPREAVAQRLGFRAVQVHVTAVQLSRGKLEAQVVHALAQVAGTINRLASDVTLYASAEFGFVRLPDAFCTGSSIMPQKKNPDVVELARATYHRVVAELHLLLTLPANLPSGYHRDLQMTKASVMKAVLSVRDLLSAVSGFMAGIQFDVGRTKEASSSELHATAAALARVVSGTPFREAYRDAAADRDAWEAEAARSAEEVYQVTGFPGRTDPGLVLERLRSASTWLRSDVTP